jgi:hypothetical protein
VSTEHDDYREPDAGPDRPWWVQVGLFGLPTRASAWAFVWLSVLLAAAGAAGVLFYWPLGLGVLFLLAALWYYLCIRWVDRNGRWA